MKNQNSNIELDESNKALSPESREEDNDRFTITRTNDNRLKQQMTDAFNAAYERGIRFCQDPMQGGYQGMERAANIDLPLDAPCAHLAEIVFVILCGEDSDGPDYSVEGEFWQIQFEQEGGIWVPTKMQILGFYQGVRDYWNAQEAALCEHQLN